jgi:hypothetical protein
MPQKPVVVYTSINEVPTEWLTDFPSNAQEAFQRGITKYFDLQPCRKGHFSLKSQSKGKSKGCITCTQLKQRDKTKAERVARGLEDYSLQDFVREANLKHGKGRYDYSLIQEFRNKTDEYWIVCPKCCCFRQKASKHLSGQGCNKCNLSSSMERRRITQDEYISRCRKAHGDRYDYSAIRYTVMAAPVTPICKLPGHGIFETQANNFMRGRSGCQVCAALETSKRCRRDRESFIKKAKEKHGNAKYVYDLVVYTTSQEKVKIICHKNGHGVFDQTPSSHLSGSGCPRCAEVSRAERWAMNMEDFLKRSREKHGDKYDYSRVRLGDLCGVTSRGHTKVEIICPKHGAFLQAPLVHFRSGCRKCHMDFLWNELLAVGRAEWIARCNRVHNGKYDYSRVHNFTKVLDECVSIVCPVRGHGEFSQRARDHLAGRGCQKCGDLNRGRDGYYAFLANEIWAEIETELYFVEAFGQYCKFGIAIDFEDRARNVYTDVYYRRLMSRAVAWTAEQYLLLATSWAIPGSLPASVADWGGATELRNKDFSCSEMALLMDDLVDQVEEIGWDKFCRLHLFSKTI